MSLVNVLPYWLLVLRGGKLVSNSNESEQGIRGVLMSPFPYRWEWMMNNPLGCVPPVLFIQVNQCLTGFGKHQQKISLRQIRRPCVLTHATLNRHPLRPVRPELPGNARSNSMRPEFPCNAGSHPMPPGSRCELLCVRMGGCLIAAS